MNRDQISTRQLMVLLFLGQLSPGIQLLGGRMAKQAGAAGWLALLGALPLLLILGWAVGRLTRGIPLGQGLADGFRLGLGKWGGRIAALLYIVWGFLLLMVQLRLYGERMTAITAGDTGMWFFLLVLAAVLAWMGSGKLSAFARAGEIFYLAMLPLLIVVLIAGALQMDGLNLMPVQALELAGVPAAALEGAALLSPALYGGFLLPAVRRDGGAAATRRRWTAALCLVLAAVELVVLGGMGPALAARSEAPLFLLTRDLSIGGAVQRLEGLTMALWVLSDLVLLGVMLFSLRRLVGWLCGAEWRFLPALLLGFALVGGKLCFSDGHMLQNFSTLVLPVGNLILCFGLPALAVLLRIARSGRESGDISCGEKDGKTTDVVAGKGGEKKMKKTGKRC